MSRATCGAHGGAIVGGHGTARESEGCPEEPAALVEHALLDDLIRPLQQRPRNHQPECFGGLEVDDQLELGWLLDGEIGGLVWGNLLLILQGIA
jgi:hypothetical protein